MLISCTISVKRTCKIRFYAFVEHEERAMSNELNCVHRQFALFAFFLEGSSHRCASGRKMGCAVGERSKQNSRTRTDRELRPISVGRTPTGQQFCDNFQLFISLFTGSDRSSGQQRYREGRTSESRCWPGDSFINEHSKEICKFFLVSSITYELYT